MCDTFNALKHFADMRCRVVSDIPEDISLECYDLNANEKDIIHTGIPLVRDAIIMIYQSVSDYAATNYLTPKVIERMGKKGGVMACKHEAQIYLRTVFTSLIALFHNAEYDFYNGVLINSKSNITACCSNTKRTPKVAYKNIYTRHFEEFCRVDYYKNGETSTWAKCNTVEITFAEPALGFILWHIVKNNVSMMYFPYGDFRLYSKSGQTEDIQNRFPNSVRLKALGIRKYRLYQSLHNEICQIFDAEQIDENPYQGYGHFQIINGYEINYINTVINIIIYENKLAVGFRLDFDAFKKLPEIFDQLSQNIKEGILSLPQCQKCRYNCKRKRVAVFDENIFPQKVLITCKWPITSCNIENEDDIKSLEVISALIKKYTNTCNKK